MSNRSIWNVGEDQSGDFSTFISYSEMKEIKKDIRTWAKNVTRDMADNVRQLTNKEKHKRIRVRHSRKYSAKMASHIQPDLANSIGFKLKSNMGMPEKISFYFAKHGIFLYFGVGKGHPKSNPRKRVDWFNPAIEQHIDELADIAGKYNAQVITDNIRIKNQ